MLWGWGMGLWEIPKFQFSKYYERPMMLVVLLMAKVSFSQLGLFI